jgi:hypothetical protein
MTHPENPLIDTSDAVGPKVPKVRTTKVTKGINRKLWTAKYEEIEIVSHVEEVIEWITLEERQKKLDAITKCVVMDFEKTRDTVLQELGLAEKKVFGNQTEPKSQEKLEDVFDKL